MEYAYGILVIDTRDRSQVLATGFEDEIEVMPLYEADDRIRDLQSGVVSRLAYLAVPLPMHAYDEENGSW